MLRAALVGCDKRQVDIGDLCCGEIVFGSFCGFFDTLHSHSIMREVDAVLVFEDFNQMADEEVIKIFPA